MQLTYRNVPFADLTANELYAILRLRGQVFVVEQTCPFLDPDDLDQASHHLLGETEAGRLAAYSRLLPRGLAYPDYASIGRIVTAPFARGSGLGRPLVQASIRALYATFGEQPIKIGAQAQLEAFYGSLGFRTVTEPYLEDDIWHIGMLLD